MASTRNYVIRLGDYDSDNYIMCPYLDIRAYNVKLSVGANMVGTLAFTLPHDHALSDTISMHDTVTMSYQYRTDKYQRDLLYKGKVCQLTRNTDTTLTVNCKDIIYDMQNVKYRFASRGELAETYDPSTFVTTLLGRFNALNRGGLTYSTANISVSGTGHPIKPGSSTLVLDVTPADGKSIYDHLNTSLISPYGCMLIYTPYNDTLNITKSYLRQQANFSNFVYGRNVTECVVDVDDSETITAVYALGGSEPQPANGGYSSVKGKVAAASMYDTEIKWTYDGASGTAIKIPKDAYVRIGTSGTTSNTGTYYDIDLDKDVTVSPGTTITIPLKQYLQYDVSANTWAGLFSYSSTVHRDCIPRNARTYVPYSSNPAPVAITYSGKDMLCDYNLIVMTELADMYGIRAFDYMDDGIIDANLLFRKAADELITRAGLHPTVTISGVDNVLVSSSTSGLHMMPGDQTTITSAKHGFDEEYVTMLKMEIDPNNPSANRYTFGNRVKTITDRIAMLDSKIAAVRDLAR